MSCISEVSSYSTTCLISDREGLYSHLLSDQYIQRHKFIFCFRFVPKFLACNALSVSHQGSHLSLSVVATCPGKQTHSEGQCRQQSAVYYTSGPKAESPLNQGPRPTFVKTLYTLTVLPKPTSPDSLNIAWKVLKGDTSRLQP